MAEVNVETDDKAENECESPAKPLQVESSDELVPAEGEALMPSDEDAADDTDGGGRTTPSSLSKPHGNQKRFTDITSQGSTDTQEILSDNCGSSAALSDAESSHRPLGPSALPLYMASSHGTNHREDALLSAYSTHTAASHSSAMATNLTFENDEEVSESYNVYSGPAQPFQTIEETQSQEDGVIEDTDTHHNVLNFVMEDRIFLKAALELLTERDRQAPELGMMDPVVIKSGSLKKASHLMNGVWKVKYVEIRRGMFSYYENAPQTSSSKDNKGKVVGELLRKDIPLEANTCHVRAVKLHQKALNLTPGGAIFELSVSNGSKRLWMAKTRADRQLWMQTIHNAMVGGSVTRSDSFMMDHRGVVFSRGVNAKSPFKIDLRKYLKVQSIIRNAKTKQDYVPGLALLVNHSLKVPVKWIAKQEQSEGANAFREENVDMSVDQLWRDLQRDSVTINGECFHGNVGHGPERIMGALVREILGKGRTKADSESTPRRSSSDLQESQALSYARDILLSGNRTRSGGDSYFCVNTLCNNQDLVVVVPSGAEAEPVNIDVVEDESEVGLSSRIVEKSGWLRTRSKSQKTWRKLFFVLSEGTLSFYESALPRPHRLRGQIVLTDVDFSISKLETDGDGSSQFVMLVAKEASTTRDRLLLFSSKDRLLDWTYALECTRWMKIQESASTRKMHRRKSSQGPEPPSSKQDVLAQASQSLKNHATNLGLDPELVENRLAAYARRDATAMVISVRACTEYKVCTTDPQGDEREDTWATIRAHFLQSFRVNGGPNGRILRGEEIVRLAVTDCIEMGLETDDVQEDVPSSPRRSKDRRIFRRFSTSEELPEDPEPPIE